MKGFSIKTEIQEFDTFEQFAKEAGIGADDLVLCGEHTFDKYIAPLNIGVQTLFREKYGKGEPTDGMVDAILNKLRDKTYDRITLTGLLQSAAVQLLILQRLLRLQERMIL